MDNAKIQELAAFYAERYDIAQLQSKRDIAEKRLSLGFENEVAEAMHRLMLRCIKLALSRKIH